MIDVTRRLLARIGGAPAWPLGRPLGRAALVRTGISPTTAVAILAGGAVFAFSLTRPPFFRKNLYIEQADAFLHGRLYVVNYLDDASAYDGRYYVPFPPMPAVLLVPLVALQGAAHASAIPVALVLMAVSVATLGRILRRLQISRDTMCWLILAFFLGTGYWFAVLQSNGVWFFAHVVAAFFLLLAIDAALAGRAALAGLLLGAAFLSRQMSIYSAVFLAGLLIERSEHRRAWIGRLMVFGLALAPAVCVYLAFNAARFSGPLDTGYAYLHHGGPLQERFQRHGLFSPAYLVHNAVYMFLQGPHVEFQGLMPTGMDPWGTSLLFASPFVLLAPRAKATKAFLVTAWFSIAWVGLHALCYYTNGWIQVNAQRYTLDFLPIVLLLVGLSASRVEPWLLRTLVGYSVALNALAIVAIPLVPRIAARLHLAWAPG